MEEYRAALIASAEKIAAYTAARITLSLYLSNRPSPPSNSWGEERDKKEEYYWSYRINRLTKSITQSLKCNLSW
ncbi:hypothetical protein F7734_23505 [Scytonema sp. UIC 10036]|uniref:hypothetical protein n=1 Tax=Scytonema sp. UIC 10036 TaxID=2304196 RepID=UPI0012DAB825|nr:hypothetical protein [Scytonema sp. UIC 10036]MUG95162.1 hypothetical protein [Scytonema sp. UIC 10036]